VPSLQSAFRLAPLGIADWLLAVAAALSVAPVLELGKWVIRRAARAGAAQELADFPHGR
jgi:hypothetical protein